MNELDLKSYDFYIVTGTSYVYKTSPLSINKGTPSQIIKDKKYNLQDGDTLYFNKDCIIPREFLKDKYKRCVKKEKADCLIIPDNCFIGVSGHNKYVHINRENKIAILGLLNDLYQNTSVREINKFLKSLKYETINLNAGLIEGDLDLYDNILEFNHIITESDLVKNCIVIKEKELTNDIFTELISLVRSRNVDNCVLALLLMSNLDFVTYRNAFTHILNIADFGMIDAKRKCKLNRVKFMLNYIYYCKDAVSKKEIKYLEELIRTKSELQIEKVLLEMCGQNDIKFDIKFYFDEQDDRNTN